MLVSFRSGPAEWTTELYRVPVKGTRQRPFDNTSGAAWPGLDALQAPGHPSSELEALFADGSEPFVADTWSRSLSELLVVVGPAPHLYFEVKHVEGAKVWVEDDGGSILVKDTKRPKLRGGYQGDEKGRYSRIWLNKDRVKVVTKASLGWTGGDLWRRRNAAVLHACWGGALDRMPSTRPPEATPHVGSCLAAHEASAPLAVSLRQCSGRHSLRFCSASPPPW